jgi:hypothetical protein
MNREIRKKVWRNESGGDYIASEVVSIIENGKNVKVEAFSCWVDPTRSSIYNHCGVLIYSEEV